MTVHTLSPRREFWLLLTIAGIQFSHIVDFMIMMPLGPQLTRIFAISDAQFGLLVSSYTFAAGASGLLAAGYIDRFDRKRLLLVLYAGFALSTLACGLAPSYGALMVARTAAGAFGGVLTAVAHTIVADVIPFERRGRAAAVVMSSFSVATVAGVPASLWLATWAGWHAPFIAIALLCLALAVGAAVTLPSLGHHLSASGGASVWRGMAEVLVDANHRRAFVFSGLLMATGFTTIPYITLFTTSNAGLQDHQIPLLYLCGGIGSLLTARWVGRLTDRHGKVRVFGWIATLVALPLLGIALAPSLWEALTCSPLRAPVPLAGLLLVILMSSTMFVVMSGRMIPGMAILTSAADPARRGTFLAFNGAVQSAAMGLAALVGGVIISRDDSGLLRHFWVASLVGCAASLASVWVSRRLTLHTQQSGPKSDVTQEKA